MNTTTHQASQAQSFPAPSAFPQAIPSRIASMSEPAAISAILDLFDAGAIAANIAEDWLMAIENLHQNAEV
jgi:hypothetical protein